MNKFFLFVLTAAVLCGCSRSVVSNLPYEQMSDADLVAVVNGVGYSKGELERDVAITEKFLSLAGVPESNMVSRKDPLAFRRSVVNGFVLRELVLDAARRQHVELSPNDMEDFQNRFADGLSGKMPVNFGALLTVLGKDATAFRNNLKKDALAEKTEALLQQQLAVSLSSPSPSAVEKERQDILSSNRKIERDSKALPRLATNSWKSIRAGNDFDTVGKKLPSLSSGITYDSAYIDSSRRLSRLPIGTLTAPQPMDDGLEIVKISQTPDGARRIARLFFKPQAIRPVPSMDEIAKTLNDKALKAQFANLMKELKKKAEISVASL